MAVEILKRFKELHSQGIVHRDIKPQNFCLGGENLASIYVIDFGLSKEFRQENGALVPEDTPAGFVGTPRYASTNSHAKKIQTRRDDVESLGYMMVFLIVGSLPWQSVKTKDKKKKHEELFRIKSDLINEARDLDFEEEPLKPKICSMVLVSLVLGGKGKLYTAKLTPSLTNKSQRRENHQGMELAPEASKHKQASTREYIGQFVSGGQIKLIDVIECGSFGEIYLGQRVGTGEHFAIKIIKPEKRGTGDSILREFGFLSKLEGKGLFPKCRIEYSNMNALKNTVLIMQHLGPSLYDVYRACHKKFTVPTMAYVAVAAFLGFGVWG